MRVNSTDVGRIYLARPAGSPAPTPATTTAQAAPETPQAGIAVLGTVQWTRTNVAVRQGERVIFQSTGQIGLSSDAADVANPAGSTKQRLASGSPMPSVLAGALIGRIGNGAPFAIGNQTAPLSMPAEGVISLGVNDAPLTDNTGEFRVVVVKFPSPGRR